MIVTLAGRRIDPLNAAVTRFPLEKSAEVREQLRQLFQQHGATAVVSSAACGADLLGLAAAGELGLRRRIVLSFAPERFRAISVTDRPGEWGPLYDRIIAEVAAAGDLVLLNEEHDEAATYLRANHVILDEAEKLARENVAAADPESGSVLAVLVWEGQSRGPDDITDAFRAEATSRGMPTAQVLTK